MILASALAFLSALSFAASNTMLRRGVLNGTVAQAMAITVPLGALIGWAGLAIVASLWPLALTSELFVFSCLAGMIHFVFGRYCNYKAIQAMGANLVAPVQQISIVTTLVLAILVLGEIPTPLQSVGIVVVLASPLILLHKPKAAATSTPDKGTSFVPDLRRGYIYAGLSALAYGISPIFVGFGLRSAPGLATGFASGTIAYTAATIVVLAMVIGTRTSFSGLTVRSASFGWYTLSGATVAFSQLLGYMALAIAPVSVVVPIQRTAIIMRFGLAGMFNRDTEVFGARMLFATMLSLGGAMMIAIDPAYVEGLIAWLLAPFQ